MRDAEPVDEEIETTGEQAHVPLQRTGAPPADTASERWRYASAVDVARALNRH